MNGDDQQQHRPNRFRSLARRSTVHALDAELSRYHAERVQLWRFFGAEIADAGILKPLDEHDREAVVRLVVAGEPLIDSALLIERALLLQQDPHRAEALFGVMPHDLDGVAAALVGIARLDEADHPGERLPT